MLYFWSTVFCFVASSNVQQTCNTLEILSTCCAFGALCLFADIFHAIYFAVLSTSGALAKSKNGVKQILKNAYLGARLET